MRNRPVNQQQLARKLGLSHATVSRSLANNPAISAGTRERVLAAAATLGYKRSPTRALRKPRDASPVTVGVLIGTPLVAADRATFPSILAGIRRRAAIEHIDTDVLSIDPADLATDAGRRQLFRQIRSAGWRGVVLIYPFPTAALERITPKISAVSVLTEYADYDALDVIDTDHGNVQSLVARLAALGHTRIGFATWAYPVGGLWAQRRYAAYAAGLARAGLALNPRWTLNVHAAQPRLATPAAIAAAAARAIRKHNVTAWVCAADHQAYQLIADLRVRGLETPRDYSITGFDGNEPPPGLPALATLRVPNEDIGASAIAQLVSRLLHLRAARRKILVEGEFIAGQTLARPPPAAKKSG
ncbi:MAG: LacI family transcriptional regulator [Opitutaceae bacterium]|jgi:LacI family transcriptional regulator|nr:LacI family transcriptional regulator [Opitutaceae bacterium]